jgi:hypothetical protein
MKLTERLKVLIQAITISQKSGILTLDEAVNAKSAIDVISTGELNQKFAAAINIMIELVVESQKKGVYSLKDAYMIYLAVEGIENELINEVNRVNGKLVKHEIPNHQVTNNTSNETVVSVAPKKLKKQN